MLKYISKIVALFIALFTLSPSVQGEVQLWPTGIYIGMDMFRPFYGLWETMASECSTIGRTYELNASFDIHRFVFTGDYGWGDLYRQGESHQIKSCCTTNGKYFRIGFDYNVLSNTTHKNIAFLGMRYGRSFFDFNLKSSSLYGKAWPGFGLKLKSFDSSKDVSAGWGEFVGGCKVQLISILYMGCTVRYKFAKILYNSEKVLPFDILGWGLNEHENCFGYNLYLIIRIPLYNGRGKLIAKGESKR